MTPGEPPAVHAHLDEWTGEDVTVAEIERQLAHLREASAAEDVAPDLRTSVMTHIAWVPEEWLEAARSTLAGLAERHPSRTILLVPDADAGEDRIDAELALQCFPLELQQRHVCAEVVQLRLAGARAQAPASVVEPLLISDLPVFCRWRGQPPFGGPEFEQLVDLVDRLVINSEEWADLPGAYGRLAEYFERTAVSDIAWSRTLGWRRSLAERWPGIAEARGLRVEGPPANALLLHAWLSARLGHALELDHEERDELEAVAVDGEPVTPPDGDAPTPSDLLSDELDNYGRDPIYEEAVRTTK